MPDREVILETLERVEEWRDENACERCGGVGKITRFDICPVCEGEGIVQKPEPSN